MRSLRATARLAGPVAAALLAAMLMPAHADASGRAVLSTVHTAGRVRVEPHGLSYSWPGAYFEGRFRGTGVGIVLDDAASDYDVQIDGRTVTTLVTPGRTTHWINGLRHGVHRIRLVKRSESPWATSRFGGFVAAPGGAILPRTAPRDRQIEFIGDSYTAGYGNVSATRDCTEEEVHRTTNADLSFGALTARRLNADYQINAFSGRGMVRNYDGLEPGTSYRTYYDRALLAVADDVWRVPATWRPQLVVVGLGVNDFSTAVRPDEPWTPESLLTAYREAYHGFIDKLRDRYGDRTMIVLSATELANTTVFAEAVAQIVRERNDRGDDRIRYWYYAGLDQLGCHWHPSARDHEQIADELGDFLATLPIRW